jgi:hypothetical protein
MNTSIEQPQVQSQDNGLAIGTATLPQVLVQPSPVSGVQANALNNNSNQCELLGQVEQCGQRLMEARSYRILERLAWDTKPISRYAYLPFFLYVQCARSYE